MIQFHIFHILRLIAAADPTARTLCPGGGSSCDTGLPKIGGTSDNLQILLSIVFGVLAVMSVIVILVWGGLKFITDSDKPQETAKARNTIIYALIGLGVALSGELIVALVLNKL